MKKIFTIVIFIIAISIGSFVGTMCHAPDTACATAYIPIYVKPINTDTSSIIINSNTGEVDVTGTEKPVSIQVTQPEKVKYKYVKIVDIKTLQKLESANKFIRFLLTQKNNTLEYKIPEYFASDREEQTDTAIVTPTNN